MVENSLRVDPAALADGAQQFRETHEGLRSLLSIVHTAEGSLRSKWTGGSAARASSMWSDLYDVFTAHIDRLADDADSLQTAAALYRDRDHQGQADIDRQM